MNIKIKIRDIDPNPYRNTEHYRIDEEKVEQLISSFKTTSIWPVIIGRKVGKKVQIAFGHHRIEAALRLYGKDHELEIIVWDLTDSDMLKMMANENQQSFATPFVVEMETVEAVVQAFSEGKISLNPPAGKKGFRLAPGFRQLTASDSSRADRANHSKLYNAFTVADFLGWTNKDKGGTRGLRAQGRVENALAALEFRDEGYLKISQLEGLGTESCERVIREAYKERGQRLVALEEAEEYLEQIESDLKEVEGTPQEDEVKQRVKIARAEVERTKEKAKTEPAAAVQAVAEHEKDRKRKSKEASDVAKSATDKIQKDLPDVSHAADKLRSKIEKLLKADDIGVKLKELSEHRNHIVDGSRRLLVASLERLVKRAQGYVDKFKEPTRTSLAAREAQNLLR